MPKVPDKFRIAKTKEYVRQGFNIPEAMKRAGYSESYSNKEANHTEATREIIQTIKEENTTNFILRIQECLPIKKVADILIDIATKGKRDFDRMMALRDLRPYIMASLQNVQHVHNNVFFLPNTCQDVKSWAKSAQLKGTNSKKDEPLDAEIITENGSV